MNKAICRTFRKGKYGNIRKVCGLGHRHDSKLEAEYCEKLALLTRARKIRGFSVQVRYPLAVNGRLVCDHIVDFVVRNGDQEEVHETKGVRTGVWKLKYKLFRACYPNIPYFIIEGGR